MSSIADLEALARGVAIEPLSWPVLSEMGLRVFLRRDDQLGGEASGNKFYKLALNVEQAQANKAGAIVSFGGRYSNHIHALAALGHKHGIATVGIIRGVEPEPLTPTLADAKAWGMELLFASIDEYRRGDMRRFEPQLKQRFGDYYLVPEGGSNRLGVEGCRSIAKATEQQFLNQPYYLCCAAGTGATLAGLAAGSVGTQAHCLGFSVLKGEDALSAKVQDWLDELGVESYQWQVITGHHQGGYAKMSEKLEHFIAEFEQREGITIEPVYTAKMLLGIETLAKEGFWAPGSTIVAVHTGGLQGRRGYPQLP